MSCKFGSNQEKSGMKETMYSYLGGGYKKWDEILAL